MSIDRRAAVTRHRIDQALLNLGGMHAIEEIRVSDLVREAGIARSTFYAHFKGIDDFLARSFAGMLERMAKSGPAHLILPVAAIFEHVGAAGEAAQRLAHNRCFAPMVAEGERVLRRVAEARLAIHHPGLDPSDRSSIATMLSAGFLALLKEWMEHPRGRSAAEMTKRFEKLETRLVGEDTLS